MRKPTHVRLHTPTVSRYGGRMIVAEKNLCETKGVTWPKRAGWQPTCKNCRKKVA